MKQEIFRIAKLQFKGGQSKPGPELAGLGIKMIEFTRKFNDVTKNRKDEPVPVTITVFKDKTFDFVVHTSPTSYKLLQMANLEKGSENSKVNKITTLTKKQIEEIAKYKMPDMNTDSIEAAMKSIAGTAKNMGILVEDMMNIKAEKEAALEAKKSQILAKAKEAALEKANQEVIKNKDSVIEVKTTSQSNQEEQEKQGQNKK